MSSAELPPQARLFPVLGEPAGHGIAWHIVERYKSRIWSNHGQSLETLAYRGGLCWVELFAAFHDLSFFRTPRISAADARTIVMEMVRIG